MGVRKNKRYYKLGERVFIKSLKKLGVVKELNINSEKKVYKVTVKVLPEGFLKELNLWEIGKDKSEMFKELNRGKKEREFFEKPVVYFAKVNSDAVIPSKRSEDAGYDLYANFTDSHIVIEPNEIKFVPTGIASCISDDWVLIVKERGSTGTKGMKVNAGVVDSGYRGEIFVPINNTTNKTIVITKQKNLLTHEGMTVHPYEKAVAQLLMLPVPKARVEEIDYEQLKAIPSQRGVGALGSSEK